MSQIDIAEVKLDLMMTHDADDAQLQMYLDGAEQQAARFLNRDALPTTDMPYPPELDSNGELVPSDPVTYPVVVPLVRDGVFLLVRAMYERDDPKNSDAMTAAAYHKMWPYRIGLGV